ncbi:MAG TPA: HNH endonuclease signature motif containing protein [Hydrogenophaga sp.]|uniref:HNH endonuclease n=1 Tax=Hydrogenophaga sp. TaxID=1904254 RepID=UPI002BC2C1C5|nr:HNH endonuclease signature motif containing protein [Hydrogenophaga sp.]HMN92735.1 HNH endonuclease signature motif containing protein [Hydrogenophaga sp.]HMP08893.1 HNH endonuclease signature motif containing protein [Hydrogenophaga sp.]
MTPLDRLRLEKAAADCGFEMTAVPYQDGLELRSARFPETVLVRVAGEKSFEVMASDPAILDQKAGSASLNVEGYGELYALLRTTAAHARTKPNRVADEFKKKTAAMPKTTEAERLVVQRVGQGLFRGALLDYWQGKCCVTGLDVPELLRASHIRPWAQCETDEQRLDVFNGLLLAPHLDALFDAGLMTFDTAGVAELSPKITAERRAAMGLDGKMKISDLRSGHHTYLEFHRKQVWGNPPLIQA